MLCRTNFKKHLGDEKGAKSILRSVIFPYGFADKKPMVFADRQVAHCLADRQDFTSTNYKEQEGVVLS